MSKKTIGTKRRPRKAVWFGLCCLVILPTAYLILASLGLLPERVYTAADFGIITVQSSYDANDNGIDDFADLLLGAREVIATKPVYHDAYYLGGYPPAGEGVCTDLVWQAFLYAGYDLKTMIDADIAENPSLYPRVNGTPDPNIDFRRVPNLKVFFSRKATSYTLDVTDIAAWQPGDIVIFGEPGNHIGIVSDKRNSEGIPYLLHQSKRPLGEEDILQRYAINPGISGHYRFEKPE